MTIWKNPELLQSISKQTPKANCRSTLKKTQKKKPKTTTTKKKKTEHIVHDRQTFTFLMTFQKLGRECADMHIGYIVS